MFDSTHHLGDTSTSDNQPKQFFTTDASLRTANDLEVPVATRVTVEPQEQQDSGSSYGSNYRSRRTEAHAHNSGVTLRIAGDERQDIAGQLIYHVEPTQYSEQNPQQVDTSEPGIQRYPDWG